MMIDIKNGTLKIPECVMEYLGIAKEFEEVELKIIEDTIIIQRI